MVYVGVHLYIRECIYIYIYALYLYSYNKITILTAPFYCQWATLNSYVKPGSSPVMFKWYRIIPVRTRKMTALHAETMLSTSSPRKRAALTINPWRDMNMPGTWVSTCPRYVYPAFGYWTSYLRMSPDWWLEMFSIVPPFLVECHFIILFHYFTWE